jgi:hypothetical protein
MPEPERAFTRRRPGANPIALELDRLAEQRALQTLGRPREADRTATDAAEEAQIQALRQASPDAAQWAQLSPWAQQLANAWDVAPGELDAAMRRATQPFQFEPSDPYWGGLEEDEAHRLWADRLTEVAKHYPDMNALEREAFNRAFAIPASRARR